MVPGFPAPALSRVLRMLEGEPTLRRASDAVVEWLRALPLVMGWRIIFDEIGNLVDRTTDRPGRVGGVD
jgi:hypothetical protein